MIGKDGINGCDCKASNGYYVAYLYYNGADLEFEIEAAEEVNNAALILRLSVEFFDISLDLDSYGIYVNNDELTGYVLNLDNAIPVDKDGTNLKRPFENYEISTKVHLNKGKNIIRLETQNDDAQPVGTYKAAAPMIDCIYICTNTELSWNPRTDNLSK